MATIRKRTLPSGKVAWQVDFKDRNGKRRARQFPTKREADAFMVKARAEVATGTYVHDADSVTVGEAAAQWLTGCGQRRDVGRRMEKATWVGYECHIRLHICEPDIGIGRIKLSRLTRKVINEFRDRLLSGGRSETTTRKILSSFNLIVMHAQENGMIVQNPVQGIRVIRSRRVRKTVQVSVKKNVRRLIDASAEDFKPYLIVAALCGLRASEQRALRWEDVDFSGAQIHVRQRADAYNEIGEPKSNAGHRSIPMGPFVANTLKLWKWRCPPSPLGLVFPTKRGTIQSHSNILKRHFKPLCRKVDIQMRWHDLRHFAVSLWIEQGFPPRAIMEFAGHSSIQLTFDLYGHLLPSPDHQQGMAEIEAKFLG